MPFTLNQQSNFSEEQKKGISRVMEIMAAHDGGPDAEDPVKAANTKGWEQAWQAHCHSSIMYLLANGTTGRKVSRRGLVFVSSPLLPSSWSIQHWVSQRAGKP
jgi:hypothetical protein